MKNLKYFLLKNNILFGLTIVSLVSTTTLAVTNDELKTIVKTQEPKYLTTLKSLIDIESDSRNIEGLNQISKYIADRLKTTGADVSIIPNNDIYRLDDTPTELGPTVKGVLKGKGTSNIMLLAHMDTVYPKGKLKDYPFKINGNKAYGLGITDDKQGIALIIHVLNTLKKFNYQDYGTITILINSDEEVSSPGSRKLITETAKDQDLILSFESGGADGNLILATSGIASAYLSVKGKTAHAGGNPEDGINALTELSHQISQMQNLSQSNIGLKLNWTVANAGKNRNVIPDVATAQADIRALSQKDFVQIEKTLKDHIKSKKLEGSEVNLKFEVRRPPLIANTASLNLAKKAQSIYQEELNLPIEIVSKAKGIGTDAGFASIESNAAIIEGMGLQGDRLHNARDEYIVLDSIVPRIYLVTRLIMESSK